MWCESIPNGSIYPECVINLADNLNKVIKEMESKESFAAKSVGRLEQQQQNQYSILSNPRRGV